jgi:hypothetical protein
MSSVRFSLQVRERLVRLLPAYLFGGLPVTLLALVVLSAVNPASPRPWLGGGNPASGDEGTRQHDPAGGCVWFVGAGDRFNDLAYGHAVQFLLDCTTLGALNPALQWWSVNTALWFVSTLLMYHYISPPFIAWLRRLTRRPRLAAR